MTQGIEQYRSGFEAWYGGKIPDSPSLARTGDGEYVYGEVQLAFESWIGAKSEASTEPSAQGGREGGLLEQGKLAETRMDTSSEGGHLAGGGGAQKDEAK